jgi:O-methyltransferase
MLFNWDDNRAAKILSNCREAMTPTGRVLLIDPVMPLGNSPSPAKVLDRKMLVGCAGGVARTETEFRARFTQAGLQVHRLLSMPSPYSIIEGVRM